MPAEIPKAANLEQQVQSVQDSNQFEKAALAVFRFQYESNPVYRSYCDLINVNVHTISSLLEIPFLPISFFKSHNVSCGASSINDLYFESSGTTGTQTSRHFVAKPTCMSGVSAKPSNSFSVRLKTIVFLAYCRRTWSESILHWYIWCMIWCNKAGIRKVAFIYT